MLDSTKYRVFFTPRKNKNMYGETIDVSDFIDIDGVDAIVTSIDSTDYDVGVFTFGDIQLKAQNVDGYFNTEDDYRSLFKFSRDLCKVDVHFINTDGDLIVFHGLINDEATQIDAESMTIDFRVLSRDSVIRSTNVSGGTISNGMTTTAAFAAILNVPDITSVLTFDLANITPDLDFTIDDGSAFDDKPTRDALNELLLATNSVMLIDSAGMIFIQNRDPDVDIAPVTHLFGPYDIQRRENIISLNEYNTGKQRMFTAINVNEVEAQNVPLIETFGYRKKEITLDWVTDSVKKGQIAQRLLDEFSSPKIEFKVVVPSYVGRNTQILDVFSVNYPLRLRPVAGTFMPIIGVTKIGSSMEPLPEIHGSFMIPPNFGFKVIEKTEDPTTFQITLKLRQVGRDLSDGILNIPTSSIIGFAIIGQARIREGDSDTWNPSVAGAAKIGFTRIA